MNQPIKKFINKEVEMTNRMNEVVGSQSIAWSDKMIEISNEVSKVLDKHELNINEMVDIVVTKK